jgi:formylglycine-generating enzyme required for sulfatase activity
MMSHSGRVKFTLLVGLCLAFLGSGCASTRAPAAASPDASGRMVKVPAGEFAMGTSTGEGDEQPERKVDLDAFQIDQYEVTVAQYQACVEAGGCAAPKRGKGCNAGQTEDRSGHPVNCVNWEQARQYCAWAGKRLPTEAEWEKAARGTDGRQYPWGGAPADCGHAVMDDDGPGCGQGRTWPVGSKTAGTSPYGAQDMAGNVWEWVADWYDEGYYAAGPDRNPPGPAAGTKRVLRGGAWNGVPVNISGTRRGKSVPEFQGDGFGFRCAR